MPTRLLLLGAALALLTGCVTSDPAERRARDETTCSSYGFRKGTDGFAACLQRIDLARALDRRQRLYDDLGYPGGVVPGAGYGRVW